ncbi:hypothetical protein LUZ60_013134 [Juncus effusus]|nr:hypothetical protein LUZ60_013134 [Juncus effusus]
MDRLADSARLMLMSDLDDTMVDHQDPQNLSLLKLNSLWESEYRENSILVFSTGRPPIQYQKLRNRIPLLTPDITVLSVGTVILYGDKLVRDEEWIEFLNFNWDREVVLEETKKFLQLKYQPEMNQGPHKVSFYISKEEAEKVINPLLASLSKRGLDVKIIYSAGLTLEVIPKRAGKGEALDYILNKFNLIKKLPINTLVCGDSGNDTELFTVRGVYGVMWYRAEIQNSENFSIYLKSITKEFIFYLLFLKEFIFSLLFLKEFIFFPSYFEGIHFSLHQINK